MYTSESLLHVEVRTGPHVLVYSDKMLDTQKNEGLFRGVSLACLEDVLGHSSAHHGGQEAGRTVCAS